MAVLASTSPSSTIRQIVRPTIANLLSPTLPEPNHIPSQPTHPVPHVIRGGPTGEGASSMALSNVPLTYLQPSDPTVRTLGIATTLSTRKSPRKLPPGIAVVSSADPFQMSSAHLAAYRAIHCRRPSSIAITPGQGGKTNKKLCLAEAAWWYRAERGGRCNARKGGRYKNGDIKDGVHVDEGGQDGLWGVYERTCNAYSYDEKGDPYRPTLSMLEILRLVLAASIDKMLSLQDIYTAVEARWPYYKTSADTWKGSVRNNLSVHPCFQQVPREDAQGRPMKGWWMVIEDEETPQPSSRPHKEKRKHSARPLLSTDLPSHAIQTSYAWSDPDHNAIPGPSPAKKRKTDRPVSSARP